MYQNRPTSSSPEISMSTDQHDDPRLMCKKCTCEYKKKFKKILVFIMQQLANHNLLIFPDNICATSPTCKVVHMCCMQ